MNSMYNDDDMYDYYPHQAVDVRGMSNQVIKTRKVAGSSSKMESRSDVKDKDKADLILKVKINQI